MAVLPAAGPSTLAEEVLDLARARLRLVARLFAGVVGAIIALYVLFYRVLGLSPPTHLAHFVVTQAVLLALSLAMAWAAGARRWATRDVLRLGLAYQLAGAVAIALCAFYGELMLQSVMDRLSWLAVWILVFPLLVPARPGLSLGVSLGCASTAPLAYALWVVVEGENLASPAVLANTFLPNYLVAVLAVIPASLLYDLGSAATAAGDTARRLGSYRLLELLGRGGMGEVWRAEHALLARPAAVKLIEPRRLRRAAREEAQEAVARFEREARATASLTSPHTVGLYDYGVTREGTFYYVMELLEGVDLDSLVRYFGPLEPERAVHLLRQACESLAEAHRAGLVHRDVKPANVFVCRAGVRHDFVKVLDFGLVTVLGRRDEQEDEIVGTPAFMAPEVASGATDVDPRADVYALGCLAYWLLTGTPVFESGDVLAVLEDHLRTAPVAPSARAARPIPPALESLVLECLAKRRGDRPLNAYELGRRLAAVELAVSWDEERAGEWWESRAEAVSELRAALRPAPGTGTSSFSFWVGEAEGCWLDGAALDSGASPAPGEDTCSLPGLGGQASTPTNAEGAN